MERLWNLINATVGIIEKYHAYLETGFAKTQEGAVCAELAKGILARELDHLSALESAYKKFGGTAPASDMQNEFKKLSDKYDEARRIIK